MEWKIYSLRFRQLFADGYRYLDQCGAFMLAAAQEHELIPNEIKPSGAQLSLPERGIRVSVDTAALEVWQEIPADEEGFLELCVSLVDLTQQYFGPFTVDETLLEARLFVPMQTEMEADAAMLKLGDYGCNALAETFQMIPQTQRLYSELVSGSVHLRLAVGTAAFESVRTQRFNPVIGATRTQRDRAKRFTTAADRAPQYSPYGVFLDVTGVEYDPPLSNEEKTIRLVFHQAEKAKQVYKVR